MASHNLTLTRSFTTVDGCVAHEAITADGQPVTVWPGQPPARSASLHPAVALPLGQGQGPSGPCWVEHRPGRWALSDLRQSMDTAAAIQITAQLADGLAALHAAGQIHGAVEAQAVVLAPGGAPTWIGAGRIEGSPEADVDALMSLLTALIEHPPQLQPFGSAASLAARLREHLDNPVSLAPWLAHQPPQPPSEQTQVVLQLVPMGQLDEVQPDIGADAEGRGLLDRWRPLTSDLEYTEDPTDAVDMAQFHTQTRQHVLSALFTALDAAVDTPHSPSALPALRTLLQTEPLDPVPTVNGLAHGPIHNPVGVTERTADVVEHTQPTPETTEETTGITGSSSQSVITGLLFAAVLGMAAAIIMLALVWLIIGDVF
jgi:hypothetical protein